MCRVLLMCLVLASFTVNVLIAKPVKPDKKPSKEDDFDEELILPNASKEFSRYLSQIVEVIEGDEQMKKRLESISEEEIKNGSFAHSLEEASITSRSKLDEIKRMEVERVKTAIKHGKFDHSKDFKHLDLEKDFSNHDRFEIADLEKLLKTVQEHTSAIEKAEQETFKKEEMEQKLKHELELKKMDEAARKKAEEEDKKIKELVKEESKHVKHPGSKHQLEDVWKSQHLDPRDMDPKVLYQMLDLNNDGYLERDELRGMFIPLVHELKHLTDKEKDHEMNRLESHYMKQYDTDKNGIIDRREWYEMSRDPEYEKDDGWEIDEDPYSDEEYENFRREHVDEYGNFLPAGGHHDGPIPGQYHPSQDNPEHPNEVLQQQYHPNQVPQQQYHPNQVPQQQYHQSQGVPQQQNQGIHQQQQRQNQGVPQQQQQQQQNQGIHQQQQQQNQGVPQQQHQQNQGIPQQQDQRNQGVPQQQKQQNQVPQQQVRNQQGQANQQQQNQQNVQQQVNRQGNTGQQH